MRINVRLYLCCLLACSLVLGALCSCSGTTQKDPSNNAVIDNIGSNTSRITTTTTTTNSQTNSTPTFNEIVAALEGAGYTTEYEEDEDAVGEEGALKMYSLAGVRSVYFSQVDDSLSDFATIFYMEFTDAETAQKAYDTARTNGAVEEGEGVIQTTGDNYSKAFCNYSVYGMVQLIWRINNVLIIGEVDWDDYQDASISFDDVVIPALEKLGF